MKKILIVFGTRPEAIKMAPLIKEFQKKPDLFELKVCVTAQHREMLDQVLEVFEIFPDFDLNIMQQGQDLFDITSNVLDGLKNVFKEFKPHLVLVHGDTTTSFVASLAAFYYKTKVGHIEAGLRTYDKFSPWPEEINRQLTGVLADYHFTPTLLSKNNLLNENKNENQIIVTGNTVIDALFMTLKKIEQNPLLESRIANEISMQYKLQKGREFILVTGHRRENFGTGFKDICKALKMISINNPNFDIVYPVHLNPNVREPVNELLNSIPNIFLIEPLPYESFLYLMNKSFFVLTDSGGIQEEAPSLGKPVLVFRDVTERPEAVQSGTVKLVGTNCEKIVTEAQKLISDIHEYNIMSENHNPYGDGYASLKIINYLINELDV